MKISRSMYLVVCLLSPAISACAEETAPPDSDWRLPDPANLLYMQLPHGTVIMELAPSFAPENVANIKTLAREKYYDGLSIIRSQDNYVVQWGDPNEDEGEGEGNSGARSLGSAAQTVRPEFERPSDGINISTIESRDAYADTVGFADGFPVGGNGEQVWLTHCYGMVGVARGNDTDSGNGSSLYVITGHAPRHLDRNITLAGRVISGIEHLTTLPRGTGVMGFYESPEELTPIVSMRVGDEVVKDDRSTIEIMRTDSAIFGDYVESRTFRREDWFVEPTGRIEICNITPPTQKAE
jgi:cyclophilin family peptidyl-prolyl cis-trans isomerase